MAIGTLPTLRPGESRVGKRLKTLVDKDGTTIPEDRLSEVDAMLNTLDDNELRAWKDAAAREAIRAIQEDHIRDLATLDNVLGDAVRQYQALYGKKITERLRRCRGLVIRIQDTIFEGVDLDFGDHVILGNFMFERVDFVGGSMKQGNLHGLDKVHFSGTDLSEMVLRGYRQSSGGETNSRMSGFVRASDCKFGGDLRADILNLHLDDKSIGNTFTGRGALHFDHKDQFFQAGNKIHTGDHKVFAELKLSGDLRRTRFVINRDDRSRFARWLSPDAIGKAHYRIDPEAEVTRCDFGNTAPCNQEVHGRLRSASGNKNLATPNWRNTWGL